ncbi:MAG: pseudouridine synthase, partial [Sphingobacterium sp.]
GKPSGYNRETGYSREGGFDRDRGYNRDRGSDRKSEPFRKEGDFKSYGDNRDKGNDRDRGYSRDRGSDRKSEPFRKEGDFKSYGDSRDKGNDRDRGYNRDRGSDRKSQPFRKEGDFKSYDSDRGRSKKFANERPSGKRQFDSDRPQRPKSTHVAADDGLIRLNRYISNSGICSRRKADELIAAGVISVNGEAVTELGIKVDPTKDEVRYNNERLKREKMVYVLLNKPKDYITTTDDPQERKTVMHLVSKATKERIYPVGRLDRNTTGLLLLTNDGNLADKLSHPRNNMSKLYQIELNKSLTQGDLNKIQFGLELEDGFVKPDEISYVVGASKREIGIQIHSGKNRIVRRIFESLGYDVIKLDRVVYASLTKKDLPRGRWRFLEEKEIIQLKHLI